jgi:hypothetical protein
VIGLVVVLYLLGLLIGFAPVPNHLYRLP